MNNNKGEAKKTYSIPKLIVLKKKRTRPVNNKIFIEPNTNAIGNSVKSKSYTTNPNANSINGNTIWGGNTSENYTLKDYLDENYLDNLTS